MLYLCSFIAGIITALPLINEYLFILPWISVAAMLYISLKVKRTFACGLLFSLGYFAVVWHWLIYLYPMDFAGFTAKESVLIITLGIGFMSLVQGIVYAFIPVIYSKLYSEKHKWISPFAAASLWCAAEWSQSLFWFGIPWARLAITQCGWLPLVQSCSLFGSLFIGFIIVLSCGFTVLAVRADGKKNLSINVSVAMAIFVANAVFGMASMNCGTEEKKISAAALQGNISSKDKWADNSLSYSFEKYKALTERAEEECGASVIVWPESVITTYLDGNTSYTSKISSLASELNCDIYVGAYSSDEQKNTYNAIYLFKKDGTIDQNVYKKRHLVPFGEYVPMRSFIMKIFPFLDDINMFSDDISAGTSSEIFSSEDGKVGALVCFDSIYPGLARSSTADGAELIVLSTNDSWYGKSPAVRQHNSHARIRAIENGRCVVRAANTGISSLIDPKGRVISSKEPLTEGYASGEIFYSKKTTLYTATGDIIVILSFIIILLSAINKIITSRRKSNEMPDMRLS